MKYGFTGSRRGTDDETILDVLDSLDLTANDAIITGGCNGVDAQIVYLANRHFPSTPHTIMLPANRTQVDHGVLDFADHVYEMPEGTTYRDRNRAIVNTADKVIAFWTGSERSGTFMTMNMARKANKLFHVENI